MPWSPPIEEIRATLGGGLVGVYARDGEALRFEGPRPGPDWHRHDWRPRTLLLLVWMSKAGMAMPLPTVEQRVIYRRRWRLRGTTRTHQDRCPDEVGGLTVVLVVLLLKLWGWLDSRRGLLHREEVLPALQKYGCERTMVRWLARVAPRALAFQQAVVVMLTERCEPRPVEQLFPGGLPPPDALVRRRWRDPAGTSTLWQGLAWLFGGALKLGLSTTALLAEVHGRTPDLTFTS